MTEPVAPPSVAQLAKQALRRLAQDKLEPTPENFARAYDTEARAAGVPAPAAERSRPDASAAEAMPTPTEAPADLPWSDLISRLTRGLETSHRQWTAGRKRESLQRVLQGSRQNSPRLHERLNQLVSSWDSQPTDSTGLDVAGTPQASDSAPGASQDTQTTQPVAPSSQPAQAPSGEWIADLLLQTVDAALPDTDPVTRDARLELHEGLPAAWASLSAADDSAQLFEARQALETTCQQTQRAIAHRQHLYDQIASLCHVLTDSMLDLVEDDSWVQGQCLAVRSELSQGLNHRGVRRIEQLVEDTRLRQQSLKQERHSARQALKDLIHQMLQELSQLDETTGRYHERLSTYADTIGQADSLESLTGVVRDMVQDSRTVHDVISQTQTRLQSEHERASALNTRVQQLEQEIRKLSDEVSTDPLTQIANRRGLMATFDRKREQTQEQRKPLSIGLLDVDNFKKLNDTLGHQTGDEALKFLARRVSESLRPDDAVARYGGEEFVVLLPDTGLDDAQQILTRLQRQLSAEFFEHDNQKVFITFSAGVTTYRADEAIEMALDRADMALYEAKRTGKNKTCTA